MNYPDHSPNLTSFSKHFFMLDKLKKNWGWFLAFGILLIILGMLAIGSATVATDIYITFLGILLLFVGVLQVIYAFWARQWSGFFITLLAGLLYAVVGAFFVAKPTESAITLTLILSALFLVGGAFRIIGSSVLRFEQWGWSLFSGIIKFALGLLILLGWPETGVWVIGLFIGIDLIFYGWFWVLLSLTARRLNNA